MPLAARLWIAAGPHPADKLITTAEQLGRFADARFGRGAFRDEVLPLGRFAHLSYPVVATPDDEVRAGLRDGPDASSKDLIVCELYAPSERDTPLPAPHGTGLAAAYPDGMPKRAERRYLDWLLAVAERLAGRVQVPSGALVIPDVVAAAREILTGIWLTPAAMAHVAAFAGALEFLPAVPGVSAYALRVGPALIEVSVPEPGLVLYRVAQARPGRGASTVAHLGQALHEALGGDQTDTWGLPIG